MASKLNVEYNPPKESEGIVKLKYDTRKKTIKIFIPGIPKANQLSNVEPSNSTKTSKNGILFATTKAKLKINNTKP